MYSYCEYIQAGRAQHKCPVRFDGGQPGRTPGPAPGHLFAIWRALPRFRGKGSERTYRVAHNRAITHVNRRHLDTDGHRRCTRACASAPPTEQSRATAQVQARLLAAAYACHRCSVRPYARARSLLAHRARSCSGCFAAFTRCLTAWSTHATRRNRAERRELERLRQEFAAS